MRCKWAMIIGLIELDSVELTQMIGSLLQAVGEHSKLDTAKQLRLVSGRKIVSQGSVCISELWHTTDM